MIFGSSENDISSSIIKAAMEQDYFKEEKKVETIQNPVPNIGLPLELLRTIKSKLEQGGDGPFESPSTTDLKKAKSHRLESMMQMLMEKVEKLSRPTFES